MKYYYYYYYCYGFKDIWCASVTCSYYFWHSDCLTFGSWLLSLFNSFSIASWLAFFFFFLIDSLLFHMTECSRIIFYISCPNLELFVLAKLWGFFLVEMVLRDHNLSASSVHCSSWSFFPDLFRRHN